MKVSIGGNPVCPACKGTKVRGYKVYDRHGAWSQCLDGPHEVEGPDGPVTFTGWFTDEGKVEIIDENGKTRIGKTEA